MTVVVCPKQTFAACPVELEVARHDTPTNFLQFPFAFISKGYPKVAWWDPFFIAQLWIWRKMVICAIIIRAHRLPIVLLILV